jgi:DNA-binding HxlR family transcriptional regulator
MSGNNLMLTLCPIARSLEHVGDWWTMLILRDALRGLTRFDQFEKSLEIAPNMLTRRLKSLIESGLMKRQRYNDHPPRYEYVLTDRGKDFDQVIAVFLAFGNKHFAPDGKNIVIVDSQTGVEADPIVVDRASGRPIKKPAFRYAPGTAAPAALRKRFTDAEPSP